MKKLVLLLVVSSLFSFIALAQTTRPSTRPKTTGPSPSVSTTSAGTGAEGKLAVLNYAQLGEGIQELKLKIDALNSEFEPKRKEMKALEDELMSLKNKIQTQGNSVSAQVRNQWIEEATAKERAYKRKGEDYQQLGEKRLAEVTQPVYDKIFKFLDGYCQQRGIVLVVEENSSVQAGILIWHNPSTNITDDFIKEYNKANPVVGGAGTKNP